MSHDVYGVDLHTESAHPVPACAWTCRRYCNERIALSTTGAFDGEEVVILDNPGTYGVVVTRDGHAVQAGAVARYVRFYSGGNTRNPHAHFVEVQVFGNPIGSGLASEVRLGNHVITSQ